jgi:hypothetical protein
MGQKNKEYLPATTRLKLPISHHRISACMAGGPTLTDAYLANDGYQNY